MTPHNGRLGKRLTRLEERLTPARPREAQGWIWIDGRLHSRHVDEVFNSAEERARAFAGRNILFIDRVIVSPKDGKQCEYSDERFFDNRIEEEPCQ